MSRAPDRSSAQRAGNSKLVCSAPISLVCRGPQLLWVQSVRLGRRVALSAARKGLSNCLQRFRMTCNTFSVLGTAFDLLPFKELFCCPTIIHPLTQVPNSDKYEQEKGQYNSTRSHAEKRKRYVIGFYRALHRAGLLFAGSTVPANGAIRHTQHAAALKIKLTLRWRYRLPLSTAWAPYRSTTTLRRKQEGARKIPPTKRPATDILTKTAMPPVNTQP